MSIKYTQDNHAITHTMYDMIKNIKDRGGKVFWGMPEVSNNGCTNCNGCGRIVIQVITGGPFESVSTGTRGYLFHNGKHYTGAVHSEMCVSCQGNGENKTAGKVVQGTTKQPLDNLSRNLKI